MNELKQKLLVEEKNIFEGWDFSYLNGRIEEGKTTWDYKTIVEGYLEPGFKLLDMGTGGGEFLLTLDHPYAKTSVTEGYEPNYKICLHKLSPLGIEVKKINEDSNIPYEDNCFDIVINRHESYDLSEVYRVLKPNGIFITQQVGGKNNANLAEKLLGSSEIKETDFTLENELSKVEKEQFEVLYHNESYPILKFFDLGALVYFCKIIEWEFKGFSVENNFSELLKLNDELDQQGYLESIEHRFVYVLRKTVTNNVK